MAAAWAPAMLRACTGLCLLAAASAGPGVREGVCPGTGYENIGSSGMSKEKCLERAAEVHREGAGCSFVSYSPSSGPHFGSNFCRCFSSCEGSLARLPGEQWETRSVSSSETTGPMGRTGARQGLCPGTDYMNLAWSGMSRRRCISRAYEIQRDTGRCGHVSYSPSLSSDFCRCFASCGQALVHPAEQEWETLVPNPWLGAAIFWMLVGVSICAFLAAAGCVIACCLLDRRRKALRKFASEESSLSGSESSSGNGSSSE
mmetsp:Transcript_140943/g.438150  ORF Transcript_140943/g.438150 Transcript_140943/m.438150 type:complete len:259 (-) Transcript_140943:211-987(-)